MPVHIDPYTFKTVEVTFDEGSRLAPASITRDTWGFVRDADNHAVVVATGLTCILKDNGKAHYAYRIFNGTGKRVSLGDSRRETQAAPIAHFIPLDEEFSVLNED